jgi:uncharacterized membrane protein
MMLFPLVYVIVIVIVIVIVVVYVNVHVHDHVDDQSQLNKKEPLIKSGSQSSTLELV